MRDRKPEPPRQPPFHPPEPTYAECERFMIENSEIKILMNGGQQRLAMWKIWSHAWNRGAWESHLKERT